MVHLLVANRSVPLAGVGSPALALSGEGFTFPHNTIESYDHDRENLNLFKLLNYLICLFVLNLWLRGISCLDGYEEGSEIGVGVP